MLVLESGRTQHYGPAAEVMKARQQPKGAAPPNAQSYMQPQAPQVKQAVNAAPVPAVNAPPVVSTAPVVAAAPAATLAHAPSHGARVVDMLETISRSGARMGRGFTP
jgi:hypothetical protein